MKSCSDLEKLLKSLKLVFVMICWREGNGRWEITWKKMFKAGHFDIFEEKLGE